MDRKWATISGEKTTFQTDTWHTLFAFSFLNYYCSSISSWNFSINSTESTKDWRNLTKFSVKYIANPLTAIDCITVERLSSEPISLATRAVWPFDFTQTSQYWFTLLTPKLNYELLQMVPMRLRCRYIQGISSRERAQ